jgi:TetR/AcrR family transcriptional regulator, transcriptional repressor for nem operon
MTKAEKTQQLIIEKAAILFNQRGFSGTSMDDIMKATGLSKGGLYGNFKCKEDISIAAFDHAVEAVKKQIATRTHIIENSLDKLKTVVYFYKEHLFDPPIEGGCPILNTSIEADDNNPILREKVLAALKYWHERIIVTLKYGIERNEIREDAELDHFATLFISTLEGGIMLSRIYKSPEPFESTSRQLLKMINELSE